MTKKKIIPKSHKFSSFCQRRWHISYCTTFERLYHSFHEYIPVPDLSKNWISDPFLVNVYELERLMAAEKDELIQIGQDGCSETAVQVIPLSKLWAHLQSGFMELSEDYESTDTFCYNILELKIILCSCLL